MELMEHSWKFESFNVGVILIKWDGQVMSKWMWLQFAPYVKLESRVGWGETLFQCFQNILSIRI